MSRLVLVPTPIGNLQDITLRALDTLKNADFVLAEDTRTTGKLLRHFEINTRLEPYHKFNEHKVLTGMVNKIKSCETVALVSDAGTPGISDPGFLLVRECLAENIEVETLPGATSIVPALVNSGLPCDRFVFEGFLPPKKGRNKKIAALAVEERTIVLFESPYRLLKTIGQLMEMLGEDRKACISRELTKIYEENNRGTLAELLEYYSQKKEIKGEIVLVVEGKK